MAVTAFEKTFTLPASAYKGQEKYWQERQTNDVRQSAITQGYRPTGEVSFDGDQVGTRDAVLSFSVPVEVAQGAESDQAYEVTHAHVSQLDQAGLEAAVKANVDPDRVDMRMAQANQTPAQAAKAEKADKPVERNTDLSPLKVEPSTAAAQDLGEKPPAGDPEATDSGDPVEVPTERQGPEPGAEPQEKTTLQAEAKDGLNQDAPSTTKKG
jgi:hypothetical protein